MNTVPAYVSVIFILATIYAGYCLFRASSRSRVVLYISLVWIVLQGIVSRSGFYLGTSTLPPRFILLPLPPLLLIVTLFVTKRGRMFLDGLDQGWLTLLHIVRIPVELVLLWLFLSGLVPQIMTFEGQNFDILSGIFAVLIYYFVFIRRRGGKRLLLFWNLLGLILLFNIVITAVLSAPTPFQQFGFEQPNVGILYFPFSWLPGYIVPVVLLGHLASLKKLIFTNP
jgi:hypothetical protein